MPVLQEQKPVNMNNYSPQSIEKSDSKRFSLDNCVLHCSTTVHPVHIATIA